jgi:ABC-type uncharacterized transport system involved in gliding motility auxiliary subunit
MTTINKNKTQKSYAVASLAVLAAIFIGIVLLGQHLLRGARLDLTQSRQFTLNQGTRNIVKSIDEPINLYFYFTQAPTAQYPTYAAYAKRVREMLEEMQQISGGKIRLKVIDPQPFSEEEDQAIKYQLTQVPVNADKLIFGLAGTNATDGQAAVPFFDPRKEALVEYDIAKMIQSLIKTEKVAVGFISSIPLAGGFDPSAGRPTPPSALYQQLGERFDMRNLGDSVTTIAPEVKVVILVHPKSISADTEYALDQFVMRGGRLMVFVDPNAQLDQAGADPSNPSAAQFADKSSDLPTLFKAWGISYDRNKIAIDRTLAYNLEATPDRPVGKAPVILVAKPEQMDQGDVASADLQTMLIDTAGSFSFAKGSTGLEMRPLLWTTEDSQLVSAETARLIPVEDSGSLLDNFQAGKAKLTIAGNLTGKFKTAFPDRQGDGHLAESKEANAVMIVADSDMISDRLWVTVQQVFGQTAYQAFADNGDFIVNSVDKLTGDMNLINIRTRDRQKITFSRVDALRSKAQAAFADTEQQLEKELQETEQRLTELQQAKSTDNQMILSPEQQQALQSFQNKRLEINKKLRDLRRDLDKDIQSLGGNIKLLGTFAMPALLILFSIWYFRRRTARRLLAAQA